MSRFGGETCFELPFLHQMCRFGGETYSEPPFLHEIGCFGGETVGKMGRGLPVEPAMTKRDGRTTITRHARPDRASQQYILWTGLKEGIAGRAGND